MIKEIVLYPVRSLRDPVIDCKFDLETINLAQDLVDTMYAYDGVGLAAPQIGNNCKMFAIATDACKNDFIRFYQEGAGDEKDLKKRGYPALVICNPVIEFTSKENYTDLEGCLSFPGITLKVSRPVQVEITAFTPDRKKLNIFGGGLLARCLLHENDHLLGKLFIDYVDSYLKRQMIDKKFGKK